MKKESRRKKSQDEKRVKTKKSQNKNYFMTNLDSRIHFQNVIWRLGCSES